MTILTNSCFDDLSNDKADLIIDFCVIRVFSKMGVYCGYFQRAKHSLQTSNPNLTVWFYSGLIDETLMRSSLHMQQGYHHHHHHWWSTWQTHSTHAVNFLLTLFLVEFCFLSQTFSFSLCRYAITVWYFDADERAKAKEKYLTGKLIVHKKYIFSVEHKRQI